MKRRLVIVSLLSLLAVATVALVRWWPRLLPSDEPDALFRRYEHCEHVRVAVLRNYRVNDTLRLDVTLLQATDSAGWERLKADFRIPALPVELEEMVRQGKDLVSMRNASKTDPTLPADTVDLLNNDVVAISRLHQTISIFHSRTEADQTAVCYDRLEVGLPVKKHKQCQDNGHPYVDGPGRHRLPKRNHG